MTKIFVTTTDGVTHTLTGANGASVMEAIRNAGIDELLALCGGCCSCATCHVYVDDKDAARFPSVTEEEAALLDGSNHRTGRSRLSCQLVLREGMDGLTVAIAPEE